MKNENGCDCRAECSVITDRAPIFQTGSNEENVALCLQVASNQLFANVCSGSLNGESLSLFKKRGRLTKAMRMKTFFHFSTWSDSATGVDINWFVAIWRTSIAHADRLCNFFRVSAQLCLSRNSNNDVKIRMI